MKSSVAVGAVLFVFSSAAFAANGNISMGTDMFAGPNPEFPQVMHLAPGLRVEIHGCLRTSQWCDVTWRGNRGWVASNALAYRYGSQDVSLDGGPRTGVPTVAFDLRTYWDKNYRQRLWFEDRAKWEAMAPRPQNASSGTGQDSAVSAQDVIN